jgi:hypothetical protein
MHRNNITLFFGGVTQMNKLSVQTVCREVKQVILLPGFVYDRSYCKRCIALSVTEILHSVLPSAATIC